MEIKNKKKKKRVVDSSSPEVRVTNLNTRTTLHATARNLHNTNVTGRVLK